MSSSRLSRLLPQAAAASMLLALVACGGTTQFSGAQAFAIAGTPPPPPPPPPPAEPKPAPRVELRDNKIEFKEKIQFEVAKATIKPESFELLHDIAEVIKKAPQVKKISIEGHASAEGDPARNKTLSQERAKAVLDHLVKKEGIEASRLVSKGWGIEKPIAPNDTEDNREKNRRVEFLVVEQDVTQKKVEIDPKTGKERVVDTKTQSIKSEDHAPAAADDKKPGTVKLTAPAKLPAAATTKPAEKTEAKPEEKKAASPAVIKLAPKTDAKKVEEKK